MKSPFIRWTTYILLGLTAVSIVAADFLAVAQ
ncbi:hypothetical protein M2360_004421 [Rhizobium sp. SG_E_25_P2]|jgi:hypothetical protein|nr:hypothetical protein [Rhizobium sp. SG_E_25_P2]